MGYMALDLRASEYMFLFYFYPKQYTLKVFIISAF